MKTKNEYNKRVVSGQDIYDLCIQEYGDLNALWLLLADNPQLDLKRKLTPGEEVKFRVEVPKDVSLNNNQMDDYRTKDIRVNMKEKELLKDSDDSNSNGVAIIADTGYTIATSPSGLPLGASNVDPPPPVPAILTGILTSQGAVLVASQGGIIRPETAPTLGTSAGFSLITSQGDLIGLTLPEKTFLTTASGVSIETAQGDLLIL